MADELVDTLLGVVMFIISELTICGLVEVVVVGIQRGGAVGGQHQCLGLVFTSQHL